MIKRLYTGADMAGGAKIRGGAGERATHLGLGLGIQRLTIHEECDIVLPLCCKDVVADSYNWASLDGKTCLLKSFTGSAFSDFFAVF